MSRETRWIIAAAWVASRTWLLLTTLGVLYNPYPIVTSDVPGIYQPWYEVLRSGTFPADSTMWQYPPGAAGVLLLPGLITPLSYTHAFFVLMLVADAVALVFLLRGRSPLGAGLWVLAVPLLGPMILSRYDMFVTALAVAALMLLASRPRTGGFVAGIATAVKVWPLLLLIGMPRRRTAEPVLYAVLGAGTVVLGFAAVMPHAFDFLDAQGSRGIEIESVFAMPFHIARHHGWSGEARFNYGSIEFLGPHVSIVSRLSLTASALSMAWLLLWRVKARHWTESTPYDAALTAVLLFVVTSRVLSPQYMVWLIGLAAVCLTRRDTTQRPIAVLILLATPLTTWEFPIWFGPLMAGDPDAIMVLLLRNALLVAAAFWSAARLWQATRQEPVKAADQRAPAPRSVSPSPVPARSAGPLPDATRTAREAQGSG
ncbi:glycosyltransferase 87 family protein [Yinghuangia sp. YIM S10712]|uniref:glycosyltransferase 87 family protein n=1 Tax=Yinghuangia sp. YIM S10712 TaxID=3436930 RepID=UPI003F53C096